MDALLLLLVMGLGFWVWLQHNRIQVLMRQIADVERRVGPAAPVIAPAPPTTAPTPPALAPQSEPPPLVLDTPLAPDELLLDTPLPEASNDVEDAAPAPPPPLFSSRPQPASVAPPPESVREPPPAAKPQRRLEKWIAENGLAWLAGGAFAIGAISMVSYAARQAWFTPGVQLLCAVALGAGLIGVSEWARRIGIRKPPGHPLAAALLAGAGVVALYATAWAAHGLYGSVDWSTATALLALCALILIGLSFLHGEALGVLAIAMALLAPALANAPLWPPAALTLFVILVGVAGFGVAMLRRWPWAGVATLVGLYFWFAAAIVTDDIRRALAMLSFASLGGIVLAFRKPLAEEPVGAVSWRSAHGVLPMAAICVSSVLLIWTWLSASPAPSGSISGPAWVGTMFVALAAAAVRARIAHAATFAVSVGALVMGFVSYLQSRLHFGPLGVDFYPFILLAAVVIIVSAIGARPHRTLRALVAGAGAGGAAILTILAAFSREHWHSVQAWAPLLITALALGGAAWFVARSVQDEQKDLAVDIWGAGATVLLLLGIESAITGECRTAAHAGAALLFAGVVAWRGWRIARMASLSAAAIAVAYALSPDLFGAALSGGIPLWGALAILAVTTALLFGASYFAAQHEPRSATAESLNSAAVLVILIGAFLALRWVAAGGAGARLDELTESALRALTLIAAGHIVLPRSGQQVGRIAAWRGHALMGAGLLYALVVNGLVLNPWWGAEASRVLGPPLLDTLLLAFAAPAALASAAAYRLYDDHRVPARVYAASGAVFALTWGALVIRRLFHADAMEIAPVGVAEGAFYGLLFLASALGVAIIARLRATKNAERPFTHDLLSVMHVSTWAGLAAGGLILLLLRHPWWGFQLPSESNALSTAFGTFAQAIACGLALALGRAHSMARDREPPRFGAAAAAIVFALSFGHALIRWAYHQGAADDGGPMLGLESFDHAVWPLALVIGGAALTARAPGRDTVRPYLYDLQAIWATAIWPALVFAALGLWLFFNPWWGWAPARVSAPVSAIAALLILLAAAWLTAQAPRLAHARWPHTLMQASTVAVVTHLFVALTLIVRRVFHGAQMNAVGAGDIEMWTYSAAWALFGASVFWLGSQRANALLRWSGLALLIGTTAYVFFLVFTRLQGIAQFGSVLGLAAVLMGVAWFARTYRPPAPSDLTDATPGARRDRRRDRR